MKLDEILDKPAEFKVIRDDEESFTAKFMAGDREIVFAASNEDPGEGDEGGGWLVDFGEIRNVKRKMPGPGQSEYKQEINYSKTGSGNELEVFSTIKAILQKLIKERKPATVGFSASKEDDSDNRARLYARLLKKNLPSGWKIDKEDAGHGTTFFTMIREGMMKRSDPWISGDKWGPRPPDEKLAPKRVTPHRSKLETLMRKSGKSMEKVEAAWNKAVKETPDGPKKWANVMIRAKADLGISI